MNKWVFNPYAKHFKHRIPSLLVILLLSLAQGACTYWQRQPGVSRSPSPANGSGPIISNNPTRQVAPNLLQRNQALAAGGPRRRLHQEPAPFTGITAAHNKVRQQLRVNPLRWSPRLAAYAQSWANVLQTRYNCAAQNRQQGLLYGENIAGGPKSMLKPDAVVALWQREAGFYNPATGACQEGQTCTHYSQLIWRNTLSVGCGVGVCGDNAIWVCNYNPPGNIIGQVP